MRKILGWGILLSLFTVQAQAARVYQVKVLEKKGGALELLSEGWASGRTEATISEVTYPQQVVEHQQPDANRVLEITGSDRAQAWVHLEKRGLRMGAVPQDFRDGTREEVRTFVNSGPSANRIDLVFMGDGYTEGEKQKFFDDAKRLTDEMFVGKTFSTYLPVFNVHAVFKPSNTSGIGKGSPKDTAYGLYREGVTLRAIFPTNASAARRSCSQAPGCDYPIIMANDPYYGGLGGEFAITTSSIQSGTKVLRHELGHNFGRVGEEYDGGGYFGANNSSSLNSVSWKHWLSGTLRAEPMQALYVGWPWHNLDKGPFKATMRSQGNAGFYEIQYGAVGIETDDTLEMTFGGQSIPTPSNGHPDRDFKEFFHQGGLSAGSHTLELKEKVTDGDNWLSDLTVYEYGADYKFDPEHIGAYPVFMSAGVVGGYRPTHETCLMRNMNSHRFCSVCKENNWMHFLTKMTMVDDVAVTPLADGKVKVRVSIPPLGQFRPTPLAGEMVEITWKKDGQIVPLLMNQQEWEATRVESEGDWSVSVRFITPEVRKDPRNLLTAEEEFSI